MTLQENSTCSNANIGAKSVPRSNQKYALDAATFHPMVTSTVQQGMQPGIRVPSVDSYKLFRLSAKMGVWAGETGCKNGVYDPCHIYLGAVTDLNTEKDNSLEIQCNGIVGCKTSQVLH